MEYIIKFELKEFGKAPFTKLIKVKNADNENIAKIKLKIYLEKKFPSIETFRIFYVKPDALTFLTDIFGFNKK